MFSTINRRKKNENYEPILLFDIGSGSVAGAITLIFKDKPPQIIYSAREDIGFDQGATEARLVAGKHAALADVISRLQKDGLPVFAKYSRGRQNFDRAVCFLSSPWHFSRTSQVNLTKKDGFVLTEEKLKGLLRDEERKLENEISGGDEVGLKKTAKITDRRIQSSALNGYRVRQVIGRRCNEFSMSLFQSAVYDEIIEKINHSIQAGFHLEDVEIHSFTVAFADAVKKIQPSSGSRILMDVTGQVTDIYIVRRGEIRDCVSIPFGRHTLIRSVAKKLNVPASVAHSSLKIFLANKGDVKFRNEIEKEIIELQEKWRVMFREAMNQVAEKALTPRDLFLTADEDTAMFFISILKMEKPALSHVADDRFRIHDFGIEYMKGLCGFGGFKTQPDPFLAIGAFFESQTLRGIVAV